MRLAEFGRILAEIMVEPIEEEPPFAKWLTVRPL